MGMRSQTTHRSQKYLLRNVGRMMNFGNYSEESDKYSKASQTNYRNKTHIVCEILENN